LICFTTLLINNLTLHTKITSNIITASIFPILYKPTEHYYALNILLLNHLLKIINRIICWPLTHYYFKCVIR
jgi:hypothetical protein